LSDYLQCQFGFKNLIELIQDGMIPGMMIRKSYVILELQGLIQDVEVQDHLLL
jgi:hypothetical protein